MTGQLTLYDDWLARANRLKDAAAPGDRFELRILSFLLRRYRHAAEAARPSLGPAGAGLFVNDRALVVHHHLRRKEVAEVKSRNDAAARMRGILDRMTTSTATLPDSSAAPRSMHDPQARRRRWADRRRGHLADRDPLRRMAAARQVGAYGDLEDVGLLLDLLALPIAADEHPLERETLRSALERLSRLPAHEPAAGNEGIIPSIAEPPPQSTATSLLLAGIQFVLTLLVLACPFVIPVVISWLDHAVVRGPAAPSKAEYNVALAVVALSALFLIGLAVAALIRVLEVLRRRS